MKSLHYPKNIQLLVSILYKYNLLNFAINFYTRQNQKMKIHTIYYTCVPKQLTAKCWNSKSDKRQFGSKSIIPNCVLSSFECGLRWLLSTWSLTRSEPLPSSGLLMTGINFGIRLRDIWELQDLVWWWHY